EDVILFENHKTLGNKWVELAKLLPGRTPNHVKNRYYSTMRRLHRQAIKHSVGGPGHEGPFNGDGGQPMESDMYGGTMKTQGTQEHEKSSLTGTW
ncbi:unnamed protein product, partial [Discosporangium mesarthrocarpum]